LRKYRVDHSYVDMQTENHKRYREMRRIVPAGTAITVLHIGDQETSVATGTGSEPEKVLLLDIGSRRTAAEFFFHTPPTPGEIENAIMRVEDEVTRAREIVAAYPTLISSDVSILEVAQIAGGHAGSALPLPIEAVEQVFALLASHSLGRPVSSAGIPDNPAFAATLLILREFMHHLKFTSISVMPR
jgi:exopolyphosphatase/pppGpp-phosphohydrolase